MKKILIIGGNPIIREELIALLRQSNYQVIAASSGKEGIQLALKHLPDLILFDCPPVDNRDRSWSHLQTGAVLNGTGSQEAGLQHYDDPVPPANASGLLHSFEYLFRNPYARNEMQGVREFHEQNPQRAMHDFMNGRVVRRYKKKQTLFDEGHHPKNIFYIRKGKVKIFKINEDGRELVMRLYDENEFLGYVPVLEDTRYKDSAKAIENTEVAIIPRSDFDAFIHSHPWALNMFIRQLAAEVGDCQQLLLGMAYNPLRKKVAETLLRLISKMQPFHPRQHFLKLSRPTLAALAGTATESLIRALSEFKKENLIDIRDGKIFILDPRKLTRMRH